MLTRVPETKFDEWIAPRYDILWPELLHPAVLDAAVDVLADLAAGGSAPSSASGPVAWPCR